MRWRDLSAIERTIVALVVVTFGVVIYTTVVEEQRWQEFVSTHGCRVIETMSASTSTAFVDGRMVTMRTERQQKYECRDGSVHWR